MPTRRDVTDRITSAGMTLVELLAATVVGALVVGGGLKLYLVFSNEFARAALASELSQSALRSMSYIQGQAEVATSATLSTGARSSELSVQAWNGVGVNFWYNPGNETVTYEKNNGPTMVLTTNVVQVPWQQIAPSGGTPLLKLDFVLQKSGPSGQPVRASAVTEVALNPNP